MPYSSFFFRVSEWSDEDVVVRAILCVRRDGDVKNARFADALSKLKGWA